MIQGAFLQNVWPEMCAAYRDGGLADACLALQEQFDSDIPLLLVLCLADRAEIGPDQNALGQLIADADKWRETTIRPLRTIRQSMKGQFGDPAEERLRADVKHLELEAERLHVQRIASSLVGLGASASPSAPQYLLSRGASSSEADAFTRIFNHAYDTQVTPAATPD